MRPFKSGFCFWSIMIPITLTGCGGGDNSSAAVVRDSAGITIVENAGGIWEDGERWLASTEHTVNIGVIDGPAEYQLYRVTDILCLTDGRIVVAASNELRFYNANGEYLSTSGREGEGPGEFQRLGWVSKWHGDSLVAFDWGQSRVSLLDDHGEFGRSFRIEPEGDFFFVMGEGAFADGTILVKAPHNFRGGIEDGPNRNDEELQTYSNTGEFVQSVGDYPGPDQFIQSGRDGENAFIMMMSPPFGRRPPLAVYRGHFFTGAQDSYEIERHAQDGALEMLIRRNVEPRSVTDADVAAYIERELADMDDESARQSRRSSYDDMPTPETMPAYGTFVVDDLGNLWVQDYEPDPDDRINWSVFNEGGQLLGTVVLASGLNVKQIGDNFVVGVWRDEYDVEHVLMYDLIKPERDRS